MDKLSQEQLRVILESDVVSTQRCIEMNFGIITYDKYRDCYLGKTIDCDNRKRAVYWFGLLYDGTEAYSYYSLTDMLNDKVFFNKSLIDVLNHVIWYSLDGGSIQEMLPLYYSGQGPMRSKAK